MNKIIIKLFSIIAKFLLKNKLGKFFIEEVLKSCFNNIYIVNHNGIELKFTVPNNINQFRINSFSTKEPETLEWINNFIENSILWDIGANIGLYSCYAAKARKCIVYSFEPSLFNLELLGRNIYLNQLQSKITIVPLPLSNKTMKNKLNMTSMEWGGALSTFGEEYGYDGKILNSIFEFTTIGTSIDLISETFNIPKPDYIKIDVDGIEHLILEGGVDILKEVKGILIEINDDFEDQKNKCNEILTYSGLTFIEKKHSEISSNSPYKNIYNQIWIRDLK